MSRQPKLTASLLTLIGLALARALLSAGTAFPESARATDDAGPPAAAAVPAPAHGGLGTREIQVPPPPFSEGIFPCMECHSQFEPNPARRVLEAYHQDIELRHDEQNRWCLDCHDQRDRNSLRLASGTLVPFERSYLLCGQCHGPTLRSWKAGVHGKRTGRWDGEERYYLLCVHCHNPHQPRFPHIQPMPPPIAPDQLRASLRRPMPPLVFKPILPFTSPPDSAPADSSGDTAPPSEDPHHAE